MASIHPHLSSCSLSIGMRRPFKYRQFKFNNNTPANSVFHPYTDCRNCYYSFSTFFGISALQCMYEWVAHVPLTLNRHTTSYALMCSLWTICARFFCFLFFKSINNIHWAHVNRSTHTKKNSIRVHCIYRFDYFVSTNEIERWTPLMDYCCR